MNYQQAHELIQTGDLLSCAGPWTFSRLIRLMTKSDTSHVGIACWIQFNTEQRRLCIFEAIEGVGIRIQPLHFYLSTIFWPTGGKMWWSPLKSKEINGAGLMDFCLQAWGKGYVGPYQFIVAMLPLLQRIRKWLGKLLDTDKNKYHCAELVTAALMEQGYIHNKEPSFTTPGEVSKFSCWGPRILLENDYEMDQ